MNNRRNDIILRIGRYFACLWMALTGRNPYADDSYEVCKKLEELQQLKESYCAALDRWEEANKKVGELSQSNAILQSQVEGYRALLKSQVEGYRALVENLRERIRDKERIIDEYQKSPI